MSFYRTAFRGALRCALLTLVAGATVPVSAATLLPQSWNGWRWARTGNLAIQVGMNVSDTWKPYVTQAAATWSTSPNIDYVVKAGAVKSGGCSAVYGTLQVCSGNYGATGWMGYTTAWTIGTSIIQATIQLNEYYFSQARFNTPAFRAMIACQEMGNALGLQDSNRSYTDANLGSCMDYTNDPTGKLGTNGKLANTTASASDLANLARIYSTPDKTQLAQTKATGVYTNAFAAPVPEPASWMMMIGGFGMAGLTLRARRRQSHAAVLSR
jgi:hypothetical protein